MKNIHITSAFCLIIVICHSQGVKISESAGSPDPAAGLEIDFTDKGFLPPRITSEQRDAISPPIPAGLTIYNTTTNCTNVYNGSAWYEICGTCIPGLPPAPSEITGLTEQCPGSPAQVYTVDEVSLATSYAWTLPEGWIITGGAGSSSIEVTAGGSGQNGNITVSAQNGCGVSSSSSLAVSVGALPGSPVGASHSSTSSQITWNWNAVSGAIGYRWNTVNDYGTSTAAVGTTYTQTALSCGTDYTLYVWAENECGPSSVTILGQSTSACVMATCLAWFNAGNTSDGLYTVDPDGAGPAAPFSAYCDMTNDGGGWTLVAAGRSLNTNQMSPGNSAVGVLTSPGQSSHARLSFSMWNQLGSVVRWRSGNVTKFYTKHGSQAITTGGWVSSYGSEPSPDCSSGPSGPWITGRPYHICDCYNLFANNIGLFWNGDGNGGNAAGEYVLNNDGGTAWVR